MSRAAATETITINRFVGLNTIHADTPYSNVHSLQQAQNVRGRGGAIYKRGGSLYWGDEVAYGAVSRATAIHHWYPESGDADNRLYMASGSDIFRFTRTSDGMALVDPTADAAHCVAFSEVASKEAYFAFTTTGILSYWQTNNLQSYDWIYADYDHARVFNQVRITSQGNDFPKKVIVQASNNATTWTDLTGTESMPTKAADEYHTISFSNGTAYRYYRLYFSEVTDTWNPSGVGYIRVKEIGFYEECKSTGSRMNFPADMGGWTKHENAKLVDFGDYCFGFNGVDSGVQMRLDDRDAMFQFMIDKPSNAPILSSLGAGAVTAGVHGYRYRYVREISERVREYWGAKSEPSEITVGGGGENVKLMLDIPNDPQVTHVYVERTLADLATYFYHGRISVAALTAAGGEYDDSTADADLSEDVDDDCRPRIRGVKSATVLNDVLILYGTAADDSIVYHSLSGRPQEFPVDNYFNFYSGNGRSNNCATHSDKLLLFKDGSIGEYAFDGNGFMQQLYVHNNFGNIAYRSVVSVKSTTDAFVSFWDAVEGPCVFTGRGPRSLKQITKDIGNFNFVTTDVVRIVEQEIDKGYRKFISAGYKNGHVLFSYTPIGSVYNTRAIVFETVTQSWFGPDEGYSAGPMFTRLNGFGIHGSGELLACQDALSVRPIEIDANVTKDYGSNIEFIAQTVKLGAKNIGRWLLFEQLYFGAELSNIVEIQANIGSGVHEANYYMAPSGRWQYDGDLPFDVTDMAYDDVVASLMDQGSFDGSDFFDTVKWDVYGIPLQPYQANWAEFTIYDNSAHSLKISMIEIQLRDRGYR